MIAVVIKITHTPQLQPGFGIPFGVKFYRLDPVGGYISKERNMVFLGHGMMDSDKVFVFHRFNSNTMTVIGILSFQRRQSYAAAADNGSSGAVDDIAADGADVEFTAQHVGGDVFIGDVFAAHQFDDGDTQGLGQWLQKRDIRQALGSFPFGYGLAADTDSFSQL